jgi:hypothetical protein
MTTATSNQVKWRRNSDEGSYLTINHGLVIQLPGSRVRLSKSARWYYEVDCKGERVKGTADTMAEAKEAVESLIYRDSH